MRTFCARIVLAVAALAAPCGAVPYLVEIEPGADAVVRSSAPGENYGGAGGLAASGASAVNMDGDQVGVLDTFMRFAMGDLVAELDAYFGGPNWQIESATLTLNEQARPNHENYGRGAGLFAIRWLGNDAWVEGTGKQKTPTTDGVSYSDEVTLLDPNTDLGLGVFANNGPDYPEDFVDVVCDLALPDAFIDDIRAGGDVTLFFTAADDDVGFQFASHTNKDPSGRPVLSIVADDAAPIPEPASALLFAAGVVGVLSGRLRSRKRACRRTRPADSR